MNAKKHILKPLAAFALACGLSMSAHACVTATSGGSWQNSTMTSQTGTFTATFDATPSASPTNSVIGLSNGPQTAYASFASLVRFNPTGDIDAYNGTAYAAGSTIPYSANVSYHFRVVVNIAAKTYSTYVTPTGGSELTVGLNYAFRISDTTLNYWGVYVSSTSGGTGTDTVCNFSTGGLPQAAAPVFSPAAGTYPGTQNVSITSTTGGASIRYTTDNSTPSETAGTLYSGPVNIGTTMTLKGIAFETGFTDSNITTGLYTITTPTFTITASAGSGGSISPSGVVGVNQGSNQSFTITPNAGFNVSSVTVDGVNQGAITSYTFSNVQANHTISAAFQAVTTTFTITASAGTWGSITPSGTVTVNQGANQSFAITPSSGYTVSSVTVDGANQGAINSYTFSNVQANHTISATFQSSGGGCVTATTSNGWQNASMASETGTFTATFDATPSASPTNSTIGLSNGAQTAYASFACLARFNPTGQIDAYNGTAYAAASTINYSAGVSYHFRLVVNIAAQTYSTYVTPAGGSELTVGLNYAFRIADTTLNYWGVYVNSTGSGTDTVCNFAPSGGGGITYTVTASAGSGGSISPNGAVTVNQGASQSFTISANSGFNVLSVTVDGVNQGAINSYTFSNVQANHTINATFQVVTTTFAITASAGANGSISPTGTITVNQGASQSFTITPNSGYNVSSVTVDGANQGAITSYTFSNVQANHTISAAFQLQSSGEGPYNGTPAPIPGTVQAENYDTGGQGVAYNVTSINGTDNAYRSDGVDLEVTSDTGGGVDLGWTAGGQYFKYTVNVATAGTYTVSFRVAAPTAVTDGLHLANSSGTNLSGPVNVPATGGWQTWATVTASVTLPAGQQILTLDQDNGGWNINDLGFATAGSAPNFGPNVIIFDPSMSSSSIQTQINNIYNQQSSGTAGQFDSSRYALLFKPGTYNNTVNVGYYTQVLGLGQSPDNVTINGGVISNAALSGNNATCNFWEGAENLSVVPAGGTDQWAVSQACPMRRMHIKGSIILDQNGGWASGGFLSDSLIDNQINSGTQQQWISRNSKWGSWTGANWNMVFVGCTNAPSGANWPNPPDTVVNQTPVVREKPFLTIDGSGNYSVFVPALSSNSSGITWASGSSAGQSIPISQFYIAHSSSDTAATLNAALSQGKNLLLTPGIYSINATLQVNNPNTVVLGLGLATLLSQNGATTMTVADVDGVTISGILFDAGSTNSAYQLQVGPTGSSANHAANPTVLHDLFFRVGGATVGKTSVSLQINSNNVIGDDFWIWRADHGNGGTVGWTTNTATNGIVVNGANVTIYGLATEHYQQYQTLWNGNGGSVYFYQSEAPYDVPNQSSWTVGGENGYSSYKVANTVTSHQAYGVGVYCYFNVNSAVKLNNAIEVPTSGLNGGMIHDMTTVSLGGVGEITHVIDGFGGAANSSNNVVHLVQ